MVNPTLWGPATWQFLFSCAWHCKRKDIPALHYLVFVLTPRILPCVKCREHHISNHKRVIRRLGSSYETGHDIFRYLWHLKDEVNRSMGCKSIKIDDLTERFTFHGANVDDISIGDTMTTFAISANELKEEDAFVNMCKILSEILPLPTDSELRRGLSDMQIESILALSLRTARSVRIERGFPTHSIAHYKTFAED